MTKRKNVFLMTDLGLLLYPVYYSNISSGMTDILGYTLYAKLFHLSTSIRHTIISCHQKPSRTAEIGNTLQDMPIRKI